MLLLLGDVHCRYDVINQQLRDVVTRFGVWPEAVLQLGDLGFYQKQLVQYFERDGRRLDTHVHFIDGNHEEFSKLEALAQRFSRHFTHLPRCSAREFEGLRFLMLGGAAYMDSVNTPLGAVITPREIDSCLQLPPDAVDVVASHDCPCGIGVAGSPGFKDCGVPGFPGSRSLLERYAPRLWFFAHYHEWFTAEEGRTRFYGLAPAWEGYMLLEAGERVTTVRNRIPEAASCSPFFGGWGSLFAFRQRRPQPRSGGNAGGLPPVSVPARDAGATRRS